MIDFLIKNMATWVGLHHVAVVNRFVYDDNLAKVVVFSIHGVSWGVRMSSGSETSMKKFGNIGEAIRYAGEAIKTVDQWMGKPVEDR